KRSELFKTIAGIFDQHCQSYRWYSHQWVEQILDDFTEALDSSFKRWRVDFARLKEELYMLQAEQATNPYYGIGRQADNVAMQMEKMKNGSNGDFYVFKYLGEEGFLPGYAFPTDTIRLYYWSDSEEKQIARNPLQALREFAPGNFFYISGKTYKVNKSNPGFESVLTEYKVCPGCEHLLSHSEETALSNCPICGADLTTTHKIDNCLKMPDMMTIARNRISSDEEDRQRMGYDIQTYYHDKMENQKTVRFDSNEFSFTLSYEHNGDIVSINHGSRKNILDGIYGFGFCSKCGEWIGLNDDDSAMDKLLEEHYGTHQSRGKCTRRGNQTDFKQVFLYSDAKHDVLKIEYELTEKIKDTEKFSWTLLYAFSKAIQITYDLEENEISCFVRKGKDGSSSELILYETVPGGAGVLEQFTENQTALINIV
ncbi:MAG TPA: DUF1998 domain-containing protein, partial [Candidatus Cloacimonadota bacterium]|nr:DUF1998 domain-containing protein [Candidatus Cloacimonadota bacterium]